MLCGCSSWIHCLRYKAYLIWKLDVLNRLIFITDFEACAVNVDATQCADLYLQDHLKDLYLFAFSLG